MNFFRRQKPTEETASESGMNPEQMEASSAEEYLKRGLGYHAQGDHEKAEADLREVLSRDADNFDAHYNLGLVYKALERTEEALSAFKTAREKLPILEEADPVRALLVSRTLDWHIRQTGG